MTIVIGPGIEIGAGVTVSSASGGASPSDYRDLLSPSGQTAYDSAADGDFFFVSAEDYGTVFSAISGAFKIGMTDSQLVDEPQSTFARTLGSTLPEAAATVPASTLLFGFISEHSGGSMQHQPRLSTTYKGSGTYSAISNAPTVNSLNGLSHHLRKPGYSATATTTYMALFPVNAFSASGAWRSHGTTGTFPGGGYSSGGAWTTWTGPLPKFQMAGASA